MEDRYRDESSGRLAPGTIEILYWRGAPGHVAMRTSNCYISFWPASERRKLDSACSVTSRFNSYNDDLIAERRPADITIASSLLDVSEIEAEFYHIEAQQRSWNILGSSLFSCGGMSNCAGLLVHLLRKGGIEDEIGKINVSNVILCLGQRHKKYTCNNNFFLFGGIFTGLIGLGARYGGASAPVFDAIYGIGLFFIAVWLCCCLTAPAAICLSGAIGNNIAKSASPRAIVFTPEAVIRYVKQANQYSLGVDSVATTRLPLVLEINDPLDIALKYLQSNLAKYRRISWLQQLCCCLFCFPLAWFCLIGCMRGLNGLNRIENKVLLEFNQLRVTDLSVLEQSTIDPDLMRETINRQASGAIKILSDAFRAIAVLSGTTEGGTAKRLDERLDFFIHSMVVRGVLRVDLEANRLRVERCGGGVFDVRDRVVEEYRDDSVEERQDRVVAYDV